MFDAHPRAVLLLGVLGVSVSAILVRYSQAPSVITAVYRLGWTVLLLLPVVATKFRGELLRVKGRDVLLCALSGLCLALHFLTWFESLKWTGVAVSTVLVSTEVIFTALGFALFLKGRIPPLGVAAILLAFGGSALLAVAGGGQGGQLYGNVLALAAAVFVSLYTLIGKIQRGHLSTTVYTFLTYVFCFLALLMMAAGSGTPLAGYGGREWLIGLGLAVLCTLMGHSLFSWCLKYLSPAYVSAAKLCEPVFSGALAVPLFGEIPAPLQLAGAVVVLGAVLLYTKAEKTTE
ncbi:DMT family transporter [Intestinimonas massiliensis (ex Afouda et al. 2020)]|uniref:DMT family transporter n=1 Tax=Intestinimonas massiliensis (ex Afouda et al. 2020) TaxID=1673721 RepID=UPI001A92D0C5|nr:DMT family transporter [Intestinimonas massiliensis (ex Afouda et al. 2020)]